MESDENSAGLFQAWQTEFRRDAHADGFSIFRDHLRRLGLPDKPDLMLEGTLAMMVACGAFSRIDGQDLAPFLAMQRYDPARCGGARYVYTFDLFGKAYPRILLPANTEMLDLADLWGFAWMDYGFCGFDTFWITRSDGASLTKEEALLLEDAVLGDIRFDYAKSEVDVWFDYSRIEGATLVHVVDLD